MVHPPQLRRSGGRAAVYGLSPADDRAAARAAPGCAVRSATRGIGRVPQRSVPLIVIASQSSALADSVAERLRRDGNTVYVTHTADGCLRVATSVGPDVVLLDPALPGRLARLIKAHPVCAQTQVLHLSSGGARPMFHLPRTAAAQADPHAA